jgi:threonylcarbamoyladenosine tRNA methylthiotransferase MtaB
VIVNTCCVTGAAERSSVNRIRRIAGLRPKPRLIVTGCMAERSRRRLEGLPGVDEVWSLADKAVRISGCTARPARSRALLKVQDGCSNRCAFCVVRSLRGKAVSKPEARVLVEARELLAAGFREIVLVGLNLGQYGKESATSLAGLVTALGRLSAGGDAWRLRLSSIEPETVTEELVAALAGLGAGADRPGFCPHLHIPLQSGDDRMLEAMNRNYRVADYRRLIRELTACFPEICIGTDLIAGFPGETESSFTVTCGLLDELPLGYLHAFSFSARSGTPAAEQSGQVGPARRRERVARLREIGARKSFAYRSRFAGAVRAAVLVPRGGAEGAARADTALTDNYLRLTLAGPAPDTRRLMPVRIDRVEVDGTSGTIAGGQPGAQARRA